nr:immunoglobulin heavy chain junction region [Macaca mulatta]MOY24107.1 immunoglobulin heavy chain junction region [Macaca mulatta]
CAWGEGDGLDSW